jgi:phosphate:Na+ symporter
MVGRWLEAAGGVAGGLAIFLFGLEILTDGLQRVAGSRLRYWLGVLTTNRFRGVLSGTAVTALIQSSSLTTVMVVGFVTAGLLTLPQAVGVILGANLGTTITAQLIAFPVVRMAYVIVSVGFILRLVRRREHLHHAGTVLLGVGLIFLGMKVMGDMTAILQDSAVFRDWMAGLDHRLLGLLVGAVITAVVQSSTATTGVSIMLAQQGAISLEAGIALVLGATLGTCATALLAAIGRPTVAVRAAAAHIVIKVVGVGLWIGFIPELAWLAAGSAASLPRQLANAHTLFHVSVTAVLIWFAGPLVALITRLVPARPETKEVPISLHLDPLFLGTPDLALAQAGRELLRLGDAVRTMMAAANQALLHGNAALLATIRHEDGRVDALHRAIISFLREIARREPSSPAIHRRLARTTAIANALESLGDLIEKIQLPLAEKLAQRHLTVNAETAAKLECLLADVAVDLDAALTCMRDGDRTGAASLLQEQRLLMELAAEAQRRIATRLVSDDPDRIELFRLESDIVESARLCHHYVRRLAQVVIDGLAAREVVIAPPAAPRP